MFVFFDFLDLHTLGILNHSQPNGLAVPDASMHPVKSTNDVIKLMEIGLKNRAKGSTAMNERSSRSHRFVFSLALVHATNLLAVRVNKSATVLTLQVIFQKRIRPRA